MLPDFTKRSDWPVFGDTLTFNVSTGNAVEQHVGVISEWNVGGPAIWTVKTEDDCVFHVHKEQIVNIKRGPGIPEYIPKG